MTDTPQSLDRESLRMQYVQAFEMVRAQVLGTIQMCGFVMAADVVVLGYGLSHRRAGAILLAASMPILIILLFWRVLTLTVPFVYVAVTCERDLTPDRPNLVATYFQMVNKKQITYIDTLSGMPHDAAIGALRRMPTFTGPARIWGLLTLVAASVSQFGVFLLAITIFDYEIM